jgi:hypothetical protein
MEPEGFGDTGEAYSGRARLYLRSRHPRFLRAPRQVLRRARRGEVPHEEIDAIRRYGTPILHQKIESRGHAARSAGPRDRPDRSTTTACRTRLVGAAGHPGVKWALVAKIDAAEAFAPIDRLQRDLMLVGAPRAGPVIAIGAWLSRSLPGRSPS